MADSFTLTGVSLVGRKEGQLKVSKDAFAWKSQRSEASASIAMDDVDSISWYPHKKLCHLIVHAKTKPSMHMKGIPEKDVARICSLVKTTSYGGDIQLFEEKFSTKGWNWGSVKLRGTSLVYRIADQLSFNLQLRDISSSKVEGRDISISMLGDETALNESPCVLDLVRIHVPLTYNDGVFSGETGIEELNAQIEARADSENQTGKVIAKFNKISFVTPRARNSIELCEAYFRLIGSSTKFTIPYNTITRSYLLPKANENAHYFVISLYPPIYQGQTAYDHIVMNLENDFDDSGSENDNDDGSNESSGKKNTLNINLTEDEIQEKFGADCGLRPTNTGPQYKLVAQAFRVIAKKKVVIPGTFKNNEGQSGIKCSHKVNEGFLYILERGLFFLHKPATYVAYQDIEEISFGRYEKGISARYFEMTAKKKSGSVTFTQILRADFFPLRDFLLSKKIAIKNLAVVNDAFSTRTKESAKGRSIDDFVGADESDDDDFNPDGNDSGSENSSGSAGGDSDDDDDDAGVGEDEDEIEDDEEEEEEARPKKKRRD